MNDKITITIDDVEITAGRGQTIMKAALNAGVYIPHLCYHPDIKPHGSCRICTVRINGQTMAACTTPVEDGMTIENDTDELNDLRKSIVEMLFVEGNHYCMFCARSGDCELQALAYRLGMLAPRYPYMFPEREIDSTHPDIILDHNRCIQCGRCVNASRSIDGKHVFELVGRGINTKLKVNAEGGLGDTNIRVADKAVSVCPVGAIDIKDTAFRTPIGEREYDRKLIGSDIEYGRSLKWREN